MSELMSFPAKRGALKRQQKTVDIRPAGVVDAWAKENGGIALSAGNYDTTDAYMIISLKITDAEELLRRLGIAITKAKNKK